MRAERVLVVTDEMEVGGSQRQIVHLLRGLHARGRHAELLYFRERSHLVDALEADGVPVHRIDKRGAIDPAFVLRLQRFLRAGRFDVVHAFSITAELWVRLVLPFVPGLRLVSSVRGLGLAGPDWHWRAKRWIVKGSSAVISNTRAGAELVAQRCAVPVHGIDIVPNGLELPPLPAAAAVAGPALAATPPVPLQDFMLAAMGVQAAGATQVPALAAGSKAGLGWSARKAPVSACHFASIWRSSATLAGCSLARSRDSEGSLARS